MAMTLASAAHPTKATDTPTPDAARAPSTAAGPAPEPSVELLEFLGGIDEAPPETIAPPEEPPRYREPETKIENKTGVTP